MKKSHNRNAQKYYWLFLPIIFLSLSVSCTIREKPKATDVTYTEETEDLEDITAYVKGIRFDEMEGLIPTEQELKDNPEFEDLMWEDLVNYTDYIRMPKGYVADFNLKKFLSIEYIYKTRINGLPGISWKDECNLVKEFLVKRKYQITG